MTRPRRSPTACYDGLDRCHPDSRWRSVRASWRRPFEVRTAFGQTGTPGRPSSGPHRRGVKGSEFWTGRAPWKPGDEFVRAWKDEVPVGARRDCNVAAAKTTGERPTSFPADDRAGRGWSGPDLGEKDALNPTFLPTRSSTAQATTPSSPPDTSPRPFSRSPYVGARLIIGGLHRHRRTDP